MTDKVLTVRVARTGHPFVTAAASLVAVLALTLVPFATVRAEVANGYRLAGIVAVGRDYLGFLELPGGEQVLVRQGSVVKGGGRVLLLDAERLRIGLPSGVIELALEGSGRAVSVPASAATVDGVEPVPNQELTLIRRVDLERLGGQLRATPKAPDGHSTPSTETALRLAPILDLPPNSKVVAVNDRPVTSADAAIAGLERSLANNIAPTLTLADAKGGPGTRVYLLTQPK
ncbi:MAG: hypothetical protein NDI84_02695 [Steroidobacteraceae bacterium]|nr:hypothetical protein [Steroidobacteraceae bacterium]